jgi:hypothetical protein
MPTPSRLIFSSVDYRARHTDTKHCIRFSHAGVIIVSKSIVACISFTFPFYFQLLTPTLEYHTLTLHIRRINCLSWLRVTVCLAIVIRLIFTGRGIASLIASTIAFAERICLRLGIRLIE